MVDENLDRSDLLQAEKWAKAGEDNTVEVFYLMLKKEVRRGCWKAPL